MKTEGVKLQRTVIVEYYRIMVRMSAVNWTGRVDWIYLAQNTDKLQSISSTVIKSHVHKMSKIS